jgi:alcohol dehydrogenase
MSLDQTWNYLSPTKIIFGQNSFQSLKKIVLNQNVAKNILLVTGQSSMKKFGYVDQVNKMLYNWSIYHFDRVPPDPTPEAVNDALNFARPRKIELVIAMGGGSALDVGKVLAILLNNNGTLKDYLEGEKSIENPGVPLIAIPSTSGTASEVTCWSTIWEKEKTKKKKHSLSHQWMFPNFSIVDPILAVSMSPQLTAYTGMDALTHAIEAAWSKNAQPISDVFALRAIKLNRQNLKRAYDYPEDLEGRTNMALASLLAGLAFNNTKTAACHSLSYPMTLNFGIPHGLAVSITIKEVIKYNFRALPKKVMQIVEEFGCSTVEEFSAVLSELMVSLGLPIRLRDLNLKEKDIELLLNEGINPDRMGNNPTNFSREDIRAILINSF